MEQNIISMLEISTYYPDGDSLNLSNYSMARLRKQLLMILDGFHGKSNDGDG